MHPCDSEASEFFQWMNKKVAVDVFSIHFWNLSATDSGTYLEPQLTSMLKKVNPPKTKAFKTSQNKVRSGSTWMSQEVSKWLVNGL